MNELELKIAALNTVVEEFKAEALQVGDKKPKVGKHLYAAANELEKAIEELKKDFK